MELTLTRIAKRKNYTIGKLYLAPDSSPIEGGEQKVSPRGNCPLAAEQLGSASDGGPKDLEGATFCDTLEPTWRDYEHGAYKIKGKSAIPEGRYAVVISFSPKFKAWLPLLLGGPEFNKNWKGIRIHAGNTAKDTQGCILVGENKEVGKVLNSRKWLYELKHHIVEAKDRGEAVWLTIK